jgi:hypothetical protein
MLSCLLMLVWIVLAYYGGFYFLTVMIGMEIWAAIGLLLLFTAVTFSGID